MDRIGNLEKSVERLESDVHGVKEDIAGMRGEVAAVKDLLTEMRISLADLNSKLNIGEIRANVEKSHTDIYKWVATIAISVAGLGFAVYAGLKTQASSPAPHASAPPIVITIPPTPIPASK